MIPPSFDESLARALVEAAPDGILLVDAGGRIALANAEAERLFAYAPGELEGQPIELLVPEAQRGAHVAERTRFASQGQPRPMGEGRRLFGRRSDGSTFPAEISLSPVQVERGGFVAAAVRDVSARVRIEAALAEAEARVRELVEEAPDGILLADLAGRFTEVNAAACRMLGYARAELVGSTIAALVAPDEQARLAAHRARLAAPGAFEVLEWRVRRKDGAYLDVEVSGKILAGDRWQGIMRDISERKRLQREHEVTLERLRIVLEQCPVGIVLMTGQGDDARLDINERGKELLRRPAGDLQVGAYVPFVTHTDGTPLLLTDSPTRRTLRGERVEPMELVLTRPDGARIPVQVRGAPLLGSRGEVLGGIVAFEDISAEKDLERLRTEWNAIVAHDLRNPLNVIVLHARLLARALQGDAELRASVEEIQSAAARMNRMIQDLLDLSRLEARKLPLLRGPARLEGLVHKAVARAGLLAPDRPFAVRASGEAPEVLVDPDRIAQVLDNLLNNAVKYGTPGSAIVVTVEPRADAVAVAVTNEGLGLDVESLPRLFERFQRAPDGRLAGVRGIGLGLYIARELVEAHGGQITVESTVEGETTFRFTLPVA